MRANGWSRGAEEFDALVSGERGDREHHAELLDLVASLRAVPPVEARPEFVASLRTQLVAAAQREPARIDDELAARLTPRQRRGSRERRLAAVVGGFAVVSATGSMAMASQGALPGDVLYPVKRALENAQTNLQSNNASRAETLIAHAEARLVEVQELAARDAAPDAVSATLEDFTDQAQQAAELSLDDYAASGRAEPIADLRAFAAGSMDVLAALAPVVPDAVRPMLITATQTVRQIDAAAWEACPACAEGGVTEMPDFATQALTSVLSGDIPGEASVTRTAPRPNDVDKPAPPKQEPTEVAPSDPPSTEQPVAEAPSTPAPTNSDKGGKKVTDDVGETIDKVTDGLGIDGKPAPSDDDGKTTITGTLIDGVTGIVGGLLR